MFSKKRSNKSVVKPKRAASEKRPPRKNRFKKKSGSKDPNRKIKLFYFLQITAGLMAVVFVSVLLIFVHDLFTQTNYFDIKNIDIKGLRHLSKEDIITQADVHKGDNILGINLNQIRRKLLIHPWIENAQVSRIIPDSMLINITEYQPEAIAKIEDKQYLLSHEGVIFKALVESDPKDMPIITGLSYSDIPVADLPATAQFEAVREVLKMGRSSLMPIPIQEIREIKMDGELGLTLEAFTPSLLIQIGYENYPEKFKNLKRVFRYFKNEQVKMSEVDLSDLNQIVVTPAISKKSHQS